MDVPTHSPSIKYPTFHTPAPASWVGRQKPACLVSSSNGGGSRLVSARGAVTPAGRRPGVRRLHPDPPHRPLGAHPQAMSPAASLPPVKTGVGHLLGRGAGASSEQVPGRGGRHLLSQTRPLGQDAPEGRGPGGFSSFSPKDSAPPAAKLSLINR